MKREEYIKTIEDIKTDSSVKDSIWEEISVEKKERRKRIPRLYWAAVIMALCVCSFAIPVVATEVQSWILRMNPEYNSVSDKIETEVYTESEEHVTMTVVEMLSDEQMVCMTVKYEALDEEGEKWLAEKDFMNLEYASGEKGLDLSPYIETENWADHLVNWSCGQRELEELKTDSERWFYLDYNASSRDYGSGVGKLVYPMPTGYEVAYIDTTGNVEVSMYELEGGPSASEYYQPTYIQLSDLSYTIYAMQNGVYTQEVSESRINSTWDLPSDESRKIQNSIYFVMADGQKIQLGGGWMAGITPDAENGYSDLVLTSNNFKREEMHAIQLGNIIGVEIQGVYYELVK